MPAELIQFLGSLIAILLLAALAWWLKLGQASRLESDDAVRHAANEAYDGFDAIQVARDKDGCGALLANDAGEVLLLRQHGAHFAARLLTPLASARLEDGMLVVDSAEKRFGAVRLNVANAQAWVHRIEAIG